MNQLIIIGNLVRDTELTQTSSGISKCKFTVAVNRPVGSDGERKVDYFDCIAWRGLADTVSRYCGKGKKVAVTGSIQIRKYEDNDGNNRIAVEVMAQEVEFLSPKADGGQAAQTSQPKQKAGLREFEDDPDIPF